MELHGQWFSDLHINRKVVSDISDPNFVYPPNKTTTLKSGPQPKITAECPHRSVMAVGRATYRMVEKQTLHRGNWKTNHIHVHCSNILEYYYYRDGTYMYIHTCTFVHHNHRSFPTASNDAMYTYTYNDQMYTCWDMQNFLTGACTCRHGGNLRALSETTDMDSYSETVHQLPLSSAALTAVATLHLQPVHCDISVPSPAQSTLPFYWRLCTFIHSQWLLTVIQLEATRGHRRRVHVVRSLLNYSGLRYHGYVHHLLVLHSNTKIIHVYIT